MDPLSDLIVNLGVAALAATVFLVGYWRGWVERGRKKQ